MSCIIASVDRAAGNMSASADRIELQVSASAQRSGNALKASCRLVCTTNSTYYVYIPLDTIWLLPDEFSADVEVRSNTQ